MKMNFNFLTAFATAAALYVNVAAADGLATSTEHSSLLVEQAFDDLKVRGIEYSNYEKYGTTRLSDYQMGKFQWPHNRIKYVTGVLAGNVLIVTYSPEKAAAEFIMGESDAALVVDHVSDKGWDTHY